ncbi:MAG: hypothetical protein IMZ53_12965 [Thermoplasmata archaeon]|nr:hypothetical protein [Thermoplasmata archaeon]
MSYTTQKAAIIAILNAVTGIGNVYGEPQDVKDEANFKTKFVKSSKINTVWLSRENAEEKDSSDYAFSDGADEIQQTDQDEFWSLTMLYGFAFSPASEDIFQPIVDLIETAFRFVAPITGSYKVFPLQRLKNGAGSFVFTNGTYMCHQVVWRLRIKNLFIKS